MGPLVVENHNENHIHRCIVENSAVAEEGRSIEVAERFEQAHTVKVAHTGVGHTDQMVGHTDPMVGHTEAQKPAHTEADHTGVADTEAGGTEVAAAAAAGFHCSAYLP